MNSIIIILGVSLLPAMLISWLRPLKRPATSFASQEQTGRLHAALPWLAVLTLQALLLATPAHGQGVSPDPQRQTLGSLSSVGDVFVNESPAPSEVTIFSGDAIRTGQSGAAILTASGNNSFQISRLS